MGIKKQLIALYTVVRRELVRMFRISSQVFLPPIITTTLYFLIFGQVIGQRIGMIHGVNYSLFIAPGLIMMAVITNAYSNVSSSLFSVRFQKNIEEILISPMREELLLLGYVLGGVLRGVIIALLVFIVASFFMTIHLSHPVLSFLVVLLVSTLFSLAGFTNGMVARNFDDVMIVPTFLLTPLTYLGGVFYPIEILPPFWQTVSHFNPIFYMVHALRFAILGEGGNLTGSMMMIFGMILSLLLINLMLLKRGTGLRD